MGRREDTGRWSRQQNSDIWNNFLDVSSKELRQQLLDLNGSDGSCLPYGLIATLETNHMYACAMCRVHYMRVSAPLPDADDLEAQAAYWKQHYNTPLGAGTVEHFMEAYSHVAG